MSVDHSPSNHSMPDQPENPDQNSVPEHEHFRTRTQNTPTPAVDLPPRGNGPSEPEDLATVTGGTPASVGDVLTRTGNLPSATPKSSSRDVQLVREIGRYRVERVIGEGGFGVVYLAHDDQLKRRVAIKVPQARVIRCPEDAEQYLIEAQIVARLEHPFIVPVYDVGRTANGLPFIVARFVEGCNLADRMKQSRLSVRESVQLIIHMADALGFAHNNKLVHRDVKPGNILMEEGSKPFLVDFGLALREEDLGKGSGHSGTPAYMSPEQANGEGHLVDGRSDIYSLGVILYELLTGERPHTARTIRDLLKLISETDPRVPRQVDETIPPELERITLKSLAKRASERYATANDMAEDLRHWLNPDANTAKKEQSQSKIVPKGLRSFDAGDTDFFLELLPGPRDRDGLPESLRFWKTRIDESDPAKTFRVGVIYGPSGCGKSSFVKAGLLPRLADRVRVVYVEATPDETESRLLRGVERACPDLPKNGKLRDAITFLRREGGTGRKVVLVIDQFEQWLHGDHNEENAELVHALRQCDGERVQCILMVRDDFWLALSQFMKTLEIRLVEGQNFAAVYLFDLKHARKVLSAFGRAYGVLPAEGMPSSEQETFIAQAVEGLAQEEKVISVRISLFAEMMKCRAWTPATLAQVGGTEGIGVTFLEETFSSLSAPPEHRHHQEAARGVLRALLPGSGTDIKGHMRSITELRDAADYVELPKEFDDLLAILDGELRLITPTDAEGVESAPPAERYFQLTHDFLVPSLRDWLTRKQKETPQGRAELLLEDRSGVWNARPEKRQLPTLFQWIRIRRLVPKKLWTPSQAKMMARASGYHSTRMSAFGLFVVLAGLTGLVLRDQSAEERNRKKSESLVDQLLISETSRVPDVIREMASYRRWVNPILFGKFTNAVPDSPEFLHCSLAMLETNPEIADDLFKLLLSSNPTEFLVIRDALSPYREKLTERLWQVARDPKAGKEERLRAAAALSKYSPGDPKWKEICEQVASALVGQKTYEQLPWGKTLQGAGKWLIPPLADFLTDEKRTVPERGLIANLYGVYAKDEPDGYARFDRIMNQQLDPKADADAKYAMQKQQASAAIALLLMGQTEKVWPLLRHSPDPTVRTLLIDRMAPAGVEASSIFTSLGTEPDISARRALIQSLGEYGLDRLPAVERKKIAYRLEYLYRNDPDTGIHGSAAYLLRKWGMGKEVLAIDQELQIANPVAGRKWYVNGQGQTMAMITKPGVFWMGEGKELHRRRIDRSYAISCTEVTVEQYQRFLRERPIVRNKFEQFIDARQFSPTSDSPMYSMSWYEAAAYCNWLSEKEGIPKEQWCYEPNKIGMYAEGMGTKKDFVNLTGYRLPTEAEWENACRSGSDVGYTYGESDEQLGKYAWYDITTKSAKSYPVGSLRPNEHGLFDMHGNLMEWCQDRSVSSPVISWKESWISDRQDDQTTIGQKETGRVLRGGSLRDHASNTRSAYRLFSNPANRGLIGIRPARTFIP